MNKTVKMLITLTLSLVPVSAYATDLTGTTTVSERSILKADDYVWEDVKSTETVSVEVNLQTQMAYVRRGYTLIGVSSISSGMTGYETPEGDFSVLWKEDNHWSKKYKANMPYTMWINTDGIALHAGRIPGRPASHGCIRLPEAFAAKLFTIVDKTTQVYVRSINPAERMSLNMFLANR